VLVVVVASVVVVGAGVLVVVVASVVVVGAAVVERQETTDGDVQTNVSGSKTEVPGQFPM